MTRGYLQRIAQRAVLSAPVGLRPLRAVREQPELRTEPTLAPALAPASSLAPLAARAPVRPAAFGSIEERAPALPAAIEVPQQIEVDRESAKFEASSIDRRRTHARPVEPRTDDRERVDDGAVGDERTSVFPAHKVATEPATPRPPSLLPPAPVPVPRAPEPPHDPHRPKPRRTPAVAPDPLAVALAAAVRWSESDAPLASTPGDRGDIDRPPTASAPRDRQPEHGEPDRAQSVRDAADHDLPRRTLLPSTPVAPPAPSVAHTRREARAPIALPAAAPRERVAIESERAPGVHIGAVVVEILSPQVPPRSPQPAPAAPTAPARPLARGLTSPIGLRQS